jgi:2-polyprenyl-3-methyl-5-hydroxy-6-metoxy-1,4-benzoquinol methylase
MSEYNKTHLPIDVAEDRMIQHRDYIAHCLRWSHVLKFAKMGQTILDLGAADFPLCMAFYTNKYRPARFVGVEIRDAMLEKAKLKLAKAPFPIDYIQADLCKQFDLIPGLDYDIITSFEFIEHIPGGDVEPFLVNVKSKMSLETLFFLSTPCYDGKNMAENHIKEWYFVELKELLEKHFIIEKVYGTFINQSAVKAMATPPVLEIFEKLRDYYDSNYLATVFAPLYPEHARNCIWRLRRPL